MGQHPHKYEYGEEARATTSLSGGPNGAWAPTTDSVPPLRDGEEQGVNSTNHIQRGSGIGDQF